jgi:hypothetical protein
MTRLNVAAGIFVYLALQLTVYGADIIYRHGFDTTWPPHARYHVVVSGVHIIAIAFMSAVVAVGALRKRRRTAWTALAIITTLAWAGWPIARLVAGEHPPPLWVLLVTASSIVVAIIALAISFRPCFAREGDF